MDIAEPSSNALPGLLIKRRQEGISVGPKQQSIFGDSPQNSCSKTNKKTDDFPETITDSFHKIPASLFPQKKSILKPRKHILTTQVSQPVMESPTVLDSPALRARPSLTSRRTDKMWPNEPAISESAISPLSSLTRAALFRIKEPDPSFRTTVTTSVSVREPNEAVINPLSNFRASWDPKSLQTHHTNFTSLACMSTAYTQEHSPKHRRNPQSSLQHQFSSPASKSRFSNMAAFAAAVHSDEYCLDRIRLKSEAVRPEAQSPPDSAFGFEDLHYLKERITTLKSRIDKIECEHASVTQSVEGLLAKHINLQQTRDRILASLYLGCDSKQYVPTTPAVNLSNALQNLHKQHQTSTISPLDLPFEDGQSPASMALMEWAFLSFAHGITSSDDPEISQLLSRISRLLKAV